MKASRAVWPARTGSAAWFQVLLLPIWHWNWKAALLSVAIRSVALFLFVAHSIAHRSHGVAAPAGHAALHAALVEAAYVSVTAGVYAAMQQGALRVEPRWFGDGLIVLAVPLGAQLVDYLVQHAAGTPHMQTASLGMAAWSLLSASFHLHLMRNGAMLVGEASDSLARDMRRMPRLVALFVAGPVIWLARCLRAQAETRAETRGEARSGPGREWA